MVALSVRCEGEELTDTHELTNTRRKVKTHGVKPQPANSILPDYLVYAAFFKSINAGWHTAILLTPVFCGVVLLVILIFFFRSGCSPFAR